MRDAVEQLSPFWQRFDDPYGITWRTVNALRRVSARRALRFLSGYARSRRHERPVFVLGVPRSGTTMLFQVLRSGGALAGLPREGHDAWRAFHHPRYRGWRSDVVRAGEVCRGERRFIDAYFYSYLGARRFVEKTPENCLRVPYLLDLFPDAHFVVLKRNPCDVVNSLIDGWRHPRGAFRSYFVPQDLHIPGYAHRRQWCFALIDGWRELTSSPVPEIAFAQWAACATELEAARPRVAPARWTEIHLEHLLARPEETLLGVCRRIDVPADGARVDEMAALLARPVNALSPPGAHKWRRGNRDEVAALLPRIAAVARVTGYEIDGRTGECEVCR
jgi:hypothetical protein